MRRLLQFRITLGGANVRRKPTKQAADGPAGRLTPDQGKAVVSVTCCRSHESVTWSTYSTKVREGGPPDAEYEW